MADFKNSLSVRAAAAVTQNKIVKLAASVAADGLPDAIHGTGGTDLGVGVALSTVADNEVLEVQCGGVAVMVAGEALTLATNHSLCSGAAGVAMQCVANDYQVGIFLGSLKGTATAAAGDLILVQLSQGRFEIA